MKQGISLPNLAKRHQVDIPSKIPMGLVKMRELGWLQLERERWFLTPQGALFADAVAREILS
jgi:coproporphyrinogen III oxidase-like Fe-S oxidoreductase